MTWGLLISAISTLVKWYLSSENRERARLAVEKIRNIEKAGNDEIKRALKKHDDARRDPGVGRM